MTFLSLKSILLIKLESVLLFLPLILQTFYIFMMASANVCSLPLSSLIILTLFSECWVSCLSFYIQGKNIMISEEIHNLVGKCREHRI